MKTDWNRCLATLAAVAACALALPSAAFARHVFLPTMTVPTPSPGHVTAQVMSIKITGRDATKNGNTFEATTPDAASLPRSVRVFSAARAIRTRKTLTYAFYILAVNKSRAAASAAAAASPAALKVIRFLKYPVTNRNHALVALFTTPATGDSALALQGHAAHKAIYCSVCKGDARVQTVVNVDAATPGAVTAPLTSSLKALFSKKGSTLSVFKKVQLAHYDDGNAFNANVGGGKSALRGVANDLIANRPADVVATVEKALGTKLH
jgi:hypothetical protein